MKLSIIVSFAKSSLGHHWITSILCASVGIPEPVVLGIHHIWKNIYIEMCGSLHQSSQDQHREMKALFLLAVTALVIDQSQGLFFGTPVSEPFLSACLNMYICLLQRSQCNSDSGCPTFRRSRCTGDFLSCIFGNSQSYIVSGRCLNRSNLFCDVGSEYICIEV